MSPAAAGIIHPDATTYATGRETITRISGLVEHVLYCGDGGAQTCCSSPPARQTQSARSPAGLTILPSRHLRPQLSAAGNRLLSCQRCTTACTAILPWWRTLPRLKGWGIDVVDPLIEEEKAKMAGIDEIVLACERAIMRGPLLGKKILITSGPCREPVDDIRVLTTRSSGEIGRALALQAYRLGGEVTVVHRDHYPSVKNIRAETAGEMRDAVPARCSGAPVQISISVLPQFPTLPPRRSAARSGAGKTWNLSSDLCQNSLTKS